MKTGYLQGKQIMSVSEFEKSGSTMYCIRFNKVVVKHRAFLESQQYRTLAKWIEKGMIYEANKVEVLEDK